MDVSAHPLVVSCNFIALCPNSQILSKSVELPCIGRKRISLSCQSVSQLINVLDAAIIPALIPLELEGSSFVPELLFVGY
jgi:hypothetical protein